MSDVKISAKTGEGIDLLFNKLKEKTIGNESYTEKTAIVTNLDIITALKNPEKILLMQENLYLIK